MIAAVVEALLPGAAVARAAGEPPLHRRAAARSRSSRRASGSSCSNAASRIPTCSPPAGWAGTRAWPWASAWTARVMLRKGIGDIRLLRSDDPRVAVQMRDLDAYREVSAQPPARRDMSIACAPGAHRRGPRRPRPRRLSAEQAEWVEEVAVAARDAGGELPRPPASASASPTTRRTCSCAWSCATRRDRWPRREANALRDRIYAALHEGAARVGSGRTVGPPRALLAPVGGDRVRVEVADLACSPRRRRGPWRRGCSGPVSRRTKRVAALARGVLERPQQRARHAAAARRRHDVHALDLGGVGRDALDAARAHRLAVVEADEEGAGGRREVRRLRAGHVVALDVAVELAHLGHHRGQQLAGRRRAPGPWAGSRSALRYRRAPPMPRDWTDVFITGDGATVAAPAAEEPERAPRLLPPPAREPLQDARGAGRRDPGHAVRGRRSTARPGSAWRRR